MEEELFFKRFSKEKQDQVRGLVEYATLMGLTGKDLVSIGGKLDRIKQAQERRRNMEIISSFTCHLIGSDSKEPKHTHDNRLNERFKLKHVNGDYNFVRGYDSWNVRSLKTGVELHHKTDGWQYELGRVDWSKRLRYAILLDIANGKFALGF